MPLPTAERALLDERRRLTRDEALAVANLPLDELPSLAASGCRSGGVPVGLGPLDDGPGELDQQWIVGHGS